MGFEIGVATVDVVLKKLRTIRKGRQCEENDFCQIQHNPIFAAMLRALV